MKKTFFTLAIALISVFALLYAVMLSFRRATPNTDVAAIAAYLDTASGGADADDPVSLRVTVKLPKDWKPLLSAIGNAGKYVALDLSACDMGKNTVFGPGAANTGESLIVSLVLPGAAKRIKAGSARNPTFRYFTSLRSISGGVEIIGKYAFNGCTALAKVDFQAAIDIGDYAFNGCTALAKVDFQAAMVIGDYAFCYCTALTTVSLPAATDIGWMAFCYCIALTTVNLPAATSIGLGAFGYCIALESISLPSVTTISGMAFEGCTALTTVSLPVVKEIIFQAFAGCTALETLSLPATLTIIDNNPFPCCANLTNITVAADNPNYQTRNGMLLNKAGDTLIAYPSAKGAVTLDAPVTAIGIHAFNGCTALETLNLPEVTFIGDYAFQNAGTADLTITLSRAAPRVLETSKGAGSYRSSYSYAKTVTIKRPSGGTGYGLFWPGRFKRTFGDNAAINLIFEEIREDA